MATLKQNNAGKKNSKTARPTKEVSAMAWIEDRWGRVLMVCQKGGQKSWTLPGGKIERTERVEEGLKREILEEVGASAGIVNFVALFDRSEKANITFLYRAVMPQDARLKPAPREISTIEWRETLPENGTPSLKYFWEMMRGPGSGA